jgi:arylformamidase
MIDISTVLGTDTPVYPGDPMIEYGLITSIAAGDDANTGVIRHALHHATHVDAPYHFFENGKKLHEIPLEAWVGEALVVDATREKECITAKTLQGAPIGQYRRILLKTANSADTKSRVYLHESACGLLIRSGVTTVGTDGMSVDPVDGTEYPAHRALLSQGVCIIEGLCLKEVAAGAYLLVCLPLKLIGTDGANARAVLFAK